MYYILYDTITNQYQVYKEHPTHYEDVLVGEWKDLEAAEGFIESVREKES